MLILETHDQILIFTPSLTRRYTVSPSMIRRFHKRMCFTGEFSFSPLHSNTHEHRSFRRSGLFHDTWSGSLINFIGPNCTSVNVVWKTTKKTRIKRRKNKQTWLFFFIFSFLRLEFWSVAICFSSSLVRVTQTPFSHTEVVTDGLQMQKNEWKTELYFGPRFRMKCHKYVSFSPKRSMPFCYWNMIVVIILIL